ncbi:acyltransferase family protein [Alteromonas gilva]|uniref:Acyltransferase family protein n=1 Tax=Alteromonas gilva TaxID=2987522 RepID=A0ABT5L7I4_9ALTE|nr:acyltransferase family protein [Alteromonas gilva]MDC8832451.1 acyltransferase family protein [Alteromonas gilva]
MHTRRHDIDWLRTLAFGLLILYHVGMYYVYEWDFHLKSDDQYIWLQDVMIMSNQWRMSLLFFISAMALALVRQRYSGWRLAGLRTRRLMIPLLFGMAVIVPPQLYVELIYGIGYEGSYSAFMREYFNLDTSLAPHKQSAIGLLTWNHLWFLPYLWLYSLFALLASTWLSLVAKWLNKLPATLLMVVLVSVMAGIWFALRNDYPSTHALIGDWYNHGKYLLAFVAGYLLASMPAIWEKVIRHRRWFVAFSVVGYSLIVLDRHGYLALDEATYQLWYVRYFIGILLALNLWGWILMLVGYAGRYLRSGSTLLSYFNRAILPYYIFHQTLIILLAVALMPLKLHAGIEALLIIVLTCVGCALGYEVIKRIPIVSGLFGLSFWPRRKPTKNAAECKHQPLTDSVAK